MEPSGPGGTGENAHGTAVLGDDGLVHFVYQERAGDGMPWRIMRATTELAALQAALEAQPLGAGGRAETWPLARPA